MADWNPWDTDSGKGPICSQSSVGSALGSAMWLAGKQPGLGVSSCHAVLASPLGAMELGWPLELSPRWAEVARQFTPPYC